MNNNIEVIDGIEIDWNKYKGKDAARPRKSYIDLCKLLNENKHKLLSDYTRNDDKILIDFKCGHEPHWTTPNKYKSGRRCPKCVGKGGQAKEDLIKLIEANGHKLLNEYVNEATKILIDFKCGHDAHEMIPSAYKRGQGCPKCSNRCPEQAKEDFIKLVKDNGHELLSEYINARTNVLIDFKCEHGSHEITPDKYKQGRKCPLCKSKAKQQAKEEFFNKLETNNHELLSEYVNNSTKVLIDFKCGHTPHEITPANYKDGKRCPKCAGNCPEQAKEDFFKMLKENKHKLLSEYKNATTKVKIDFNCEHGASWIIPNNYKKRQRCPKCSSKSNQAEMDFINMLKDNNHKLLSEYINTKTKVLIDFNCGHEPHEITPNSYKNGSRCPKCVGKGGQAKEDFIELVKNNRHDLLSDYINNYTKVLIDFKCGHKPHEITPSNYKKGQGCPICSNSCPEQTKEDFIKLVKDNRHTLLTEYKGTHDKVLIDYNCGHEPHWIRPSKYKQNSDCYKCISATLHEKYRSEAREDFIKLVKDNNHKLLSKYKNNNTKVIIDFNCGHGPHEITPGNYRGGKRCPKCSGVCPEQAKNDFMELLKENGHKLLSEYVNTETKVLIDFNCGHEPNEITPNSYKSGSGCPYCKNKGEAALHKLLIDMFKDVETQKKYDDLKDKNYLYYDFYIPNYNLLIELDGEHHRQEVLYKKKDMTELEREMAREEASIRLQNTQYRDKLKDEYASVNGINLLRIEYNNGKIKLDKWKQLILDKIEDIEIERELMDA